MVRESRRYDFGASRKAPKTKETRSKERTDDAWPTPEPPNRRAQPWGSAMAEPCRRRSSAIPWPSPGAGRGALSGVADSSFSRQPSTFQGVRRLKRPLNPIKQAPLCPYPSYLPIQDPMTIIRLRCFEKNPEDQGNTLKRANRRRLADPRAPQQASSAMGLGHGRALQTQELSHPMAEPRCWAGGPIWGRGQFVFSTAFDVSRCSEAQTTSESYQTSTVVSVSKLSSHPRPNDHHTPSVLREKPRRPRKHAQKSESTTPGRP